ncbi:O-antigen ligase family protein [Natrinema sp. LN54]|uniref:O-antigen ligase family protein n=1 Tax=Natrinema sp. LN54 TaxID=3458705 RepID=UPI0040359F6C
MYLVTIRSFLVRRDRFTKDDPVQISGQLMLGRDFIGDQSNPLRAIFVCTVVFLGIFDSVLPTWIVGGYQFFHFWLYVLVFAVSLLYLSRNPTLKMSALFFAPIVLFTYSIAMVVWSQSLSVTISALVSFGQHVVGFAVIVLLLRTREEFEFALWSIPVAALTVLAIAIWELATGSHLSVSRLATENFAGVKGVSSIWYNRNDFGTFLAMVSPVVVYKILNRNGRAISWIGVCTLALGVYILSYNNSRSALVTVVGVLLVYSLFLGVGSRIRRVPGIQRIGTLTLVTSMTAFLFLPQLIENPFSADSSLWIRWQLLTYADDMFIKWPFGVGASNFHLALEQLPSETNGTLSPHNWSLQFLGEFGIVGIGFAVLMFGRNADILLNRYLDESDEVALALFLSILSFTLAGVGSSNALWGRHIVWILLGFAVSYHTVYTDSPSRDGLRNE